MERVCHRINKCFLSDDEPPKSCSDRCGSNYKVAMAEWIKKGLDEKRKIVFEEMLKRGF